MTKLHAYTWPATKLGDALVALGRTYSREVSSVANLASAPDLLGWDEATLGQWIETLAAQLGLEAEPTTASYGDLPALISNAAPALLQLPSQDEGEPGRFLVLYKRGKRKVALLGLDASLHWVAPTIIQDALSAELIAPHVAALQPLMTSDAIPAHRRTQVQRAILAEMLGGRLIPGCWLIRLPPGATLRQHLHRLQIPVTVRSLIGSFLAQLLLGILAWWMIGRSVLAGQFEWGWLAAWALLLVTAIPLQWITNHAQSQLAVDLGSYLKQRLLYGALQLPPEAVRQDGAGHFLGRVLASDALEQLALSGGFVALLALLQVGIASGILALGLGGAVHAVLLLAWIVLTLVLGWRYFLHSRAWDETHRALTNDLVERMVGHRTRLVQEDRAHWHDTEDAAIQDYWRHLRRADQTGGWFKAFVGRGWMVVGLGWLFIVLQESQPTTASIAISLGGVLLARQALTTIVLGVQSVVAALLAWREVAPLFQAAAQTQSSLPTTAPIRQAKSAQTEQTLLTMRDLEFRYRAEGRTILRGCSLQIRHGDRFLLEGPSGGGKSTLAALLTGLRSPSTGLLLLGGLDYQTVGAEHWRRRVVAAPQFHENHVLTGTFAFNLLMGRRWPPQPADLALAETVCRELGLGELIDRMPAGLHQIVGESGWQLSHGERSRLYIARAILQQADLVILDESFGALDPVSLEQALRTVLARAPTLLVIAHP